MAEPMRSPARWGVVGRGRAACALVPALEERAGAHIAWWWSHRDAEEPGVLDPVDAVLFAVPDGAIADAAAALAGRRGAEAEVWLHLSGARPGALLRVDHRVPRSVGCLHPVVALTGRGPAAQLAGMTAGIDGEPAARALATETARALGMVPRAIAEGGHHKVLYHAAAVTAAGHAVALLGQATALLERAGFDADAAKATLLPLMQGALAQCADQPLSSAITGPITRGDVGTVASHLAVLAALGDAGPLETYGCLARQALRLSVGGLDPATAARLTQMLSSTTG